LWQESDTDPNDLAQVGVWGCHEAPGRGGSGRRCWWDLAVPSQRRPEHGSPCSRDAPAGHPAPRPPSAPGTGGLRPPLQHPWGLGMQQFGNSGRRASSVLCWHLPSSESWVLISLWLPGRGREVALEWGGLARASIFNELDIYFSPSWLPPHRSFCHPPGLLFSPCQRLHSGGELRDGHSWHWEPPAPPDPAPRGGVTLAQAGPAHVGRQEREKGPLWQGHLRSDHPMGKRSCSSRRREAGVGALCV